MENLVEEQIRKSSEVVRKSICRTANSISCALCTNAQCLKGESS